MAKSVMDLTGRAGLAPNYFGDLNDSSPKPNLRYMGAEGQVADGIYDPLRALGYLAPANNTFADLSGTITNAIKCRVYDSRTDKVFLGESARYIGVLNGLDDTSYTATYDNSLSTSLHDMELYMVNGEPAVMFSWTFENTGNEASVALGYISTDESKGGFALAARVYETGVNSSTETLGFGGTTTALAQKFSSTDVMNSTTSGLRLRLRGFGSVTQTWTLRVSIQTDNGSGRPSGTDVSGTVVTYDPNLLPVNEDFVFFSFGSQIGLSPATYHIVVQATNPSDLTGSNGLTWLRSDGAAGLYTNGEAQQYTSGAWANADGSTSEAYDFALVANYLRGLVYRENVTAPFEYTQAPTGYEFLQKADNGLLYWFTGSNVHKYDGAAGSDFGTFTSQVLAFPEFIRCVDAADTQSIMYIAIQSSEKTDGADYRTFGADTMGVFQWDRLTTVVNVRNFIPIYGAKEIKRIFVTADGDLRVITIGEDGFTEIRGVVNGRFQVITRLGKSAYPRFRDSLDFLNNMAVWLGADGIVYALGRIHDSTKEAVYKIGQVLPGSGALSTGILMTGNEASGSFLEGVFLSWTDATNKKLQKWYPHGTGTIGGVAQTGHQGDVYSIVQHLPYLSDVTNLMITCVPNGIAADSTVVASIKFYKNMETTPFMTKTVKRKDMLKGYLSYAINKQWVSSFAIEIEWANGTLGSNDFLPAFGILDYVATKTVPKSDA